MMNINEFIESIKEEVREYLPHDVSEDIMITDTEVVKMNDQKLHGLIFKMPGIDAAPTFYVDDAYKSYMDGKDIVQLAREMAGAYSGSRNAPKPPEIDLSYDRFKDKLSVRLLEKKQNLPESEDSTAADQGTENTR